jgi:hypothetical protein
MEMIQKVCIKIGAVLLAFSCLIIGLVILSTIVASLLSPALVFCASVKYLFW